MPHSQPQVERRLLRLRYLLPRQMYCALPGTKPPGDHIVNRLNAMLLEAWQNRQS
jgi:hypothetical protein